MPTSLCLHKERLLALMVVVKEAHRGIRRCFGSRNYRSVGLNDFSGDVAWRGSRVGIVQYIITPGREHLVGLTKVGDHGNRTHSALLMKSGSGNPLMMDFTKLS